MSSQPDLEPILQKSLEMVAKKKEQGGEIKKLTLAQKIRDIQNSVGEVKKKGKHAQGWSYLRIEDAVKAVNKLMADRDLILTGTLAKKNSGDFDTTRTNHNDKGYITDLVMEWTLEDVISGEKRLFHTPGSGFDSTDKGSYKAETGSRKYTIINVFNLPVGDEPEQSNAYDRDAAKQAAKAVGDRKVAEAAAKGSKTAIDALSQVVPENKITISRPEEYNAHYIKVSGFLAPQIQQYFNDTSAKPFAAKGSVGSYWRLGAEYESGLVKLCEKLQIEVEG